MFNIGLKVSIFISIGKEGDLTVFNGIVIVHNIRVKVLMPVLALKSSI